MKNKNCHGGSTSMLPEGKSDEVKENIKKFWEQVAEEKIKKFSEELESK